MIGEFIQLNAFTKAVEELKEERSGAEKVRNGQSMLQIIWKEFITALDHLIQEQNSSEKLSTLIRIAQNNLTDFADRIYIAQLEFQSYNEDHEIVVRKELQEISREVIKTILNLRINYPYNFDENAPVPLLVTKNNQQVNQRQIQIVQWLTEKHIDPGLVYILNVHLECLHVPGNSLIKNWRQFNYMIRLADELLIFCQLPNSPEDKVKLIRLLIGFNFNPLVFYEYIMSYISSEINTDQPYEAQELELLFLLKSFDTIRQEIKVGYNSEVPTIQESIRDFITKELDTLSKMKLVISAYPVNIGNNKNSPYYFDVSATIEEIFFLLKVMTGVGFVKAKFKANLYSFVSRHIRTDRTKNPSPQYMRNIFSPNREIPVRIIRQIRAWLAIMITYIDSNFGDKLKLWSVSILSYSFFMDFVVN